MCPLDEEYQLINDPIICWSGIMDTSVVGVGAEGGGTVSLKCETSAYGLKRKPALRLNAAQHKLKYPNDTGLDFINDLIANQQVWLTKKFQKI